jgi:hypothetical protein
VQDDAHVLKSMQTEIRMKNLKTKSPTSYLIQPVWCHHCSIRIAPYALRTVFQGKEYHRDCYAKVSHTNGKFGKN